MKEYWNTTSRPIERTEVQENKSWNNATIKNIQLQGHCNVHLFVLLCICTSTIYIKSHLGRE